MDDIIIAGANVWHDGRFIVADVSIHDRKISSVGEAELQTFKGIIFDGKGKFLVPGLVDMHVHFREPGYSYKETIRTGSEAAAAGGFSTVCTMTNLNPAPDDISNLKKQLDIIHLDSPIEILPYATITKKRMGRELVDYQALAPWVAGFSDDGTGVQDADVMLEAMRVIAPTVKILASHC